MKGYKPEITSGIATDTMAEAEANARDLMGRWTRVTACRAVEVDDTPNYKWVNNKLEMIKCSALIDKAKVDRLQNSDAAHRH